MSASGYPVTLTIRFPAETIKRLRENAARDDRSVGSLVRKLVTKGLEEETKKSA
jgi:plasmid stability protein